MGDQSPRGPGERAVLGADEIEFPRGRLLDIDHHHAVVSPDVPSHARQGGDAQAFAHEPPHRFERPGLIGDLGFEAGPATGVDELGGDVEGLGGEHELLVGEFGEVHRHAPRQPMVRRDRKQDLVGPQRCHVEGVGRSGGGHNSEVDRPVDDGPLQLQVATLDQLHRDPRVVASERSQQTGDDVGRHGRVGAHVHLTGFDSEVLSQHAHRFVGAEEDRLSQRKEDFTVRGERDLPVLPAEELGPQLDLQLPHLIAEGRL